MFQVIGTIIFGAVIGVLARIVLPGKQRYGMIMTILLGVARGFDRLLAVGSNRQGQYLWHRLDPLGDQRSCSSDLEPWVLSAHAQEQERDRLRLGRNRCATMKCAGTARPR